MSRALAACLFLALSPSAFAAPKARKTVALPQTKAEDKTAFEQTFLYIYLQAGKSYLNDEAMPDPKGLDPFLKPLHPPYLSTATMTRQRLEEVIGNAECIQQGPAGISTDVYKLMVDRVAVDLDAGSIVEQKFRPDDRAGRSIAPADKKLAAACQAEARNEKYDRRSSYQHCLGQRKAEEIYLAPERLAQAATSAEPNPACGRVLTEVALDKSRFAPKVSEDMAKKLGQLRSQITASLVTSPDGGVSAAWAGPSRIAGLTADQIARKLNADAVSAGKADFRQATDLQIDEPPLNAADLTAGTKLAQVTTNNQIGFTGYCYAYVKSALQTVGIVDKKTISDAGAGAHAKEFAKFVDKQPALLHRKLLRIPDPTWPLPIGAVVVWSAGACGFSDVSGHIEIVTRIKPPQACSDGCQVFQVGCLEELGAAPAKAAALLPQAQLDAQRAQEEYDALKGLKDAKSVKARQHAFGVLRRKKAELAAVQAKLEPRVAAYVVERKTE